MWIHCDQQILLSCPPKMPTRGHWFWSICGAFVMLRFKRIQLIFCHLWRTRDMIGFRIVALSFECRYSVGEIKFFRPSSSLIDHVYKMVDFLDCCCETGGCRWSDWDSHFEVNLRGWYLNPILITQIIFSHVTLEKIIYPRKVEEFCTEFCFSLL